MYQEDLLARLRTFAVRSRSATVEMSAFLRSLPTGMASAAEVDANVKDLAVKGAFAIAAQNNKVVSVTFADFPLLALDEEYRLIAADAGRPFPADSRLPVLIPEKDVATVDVKTGLGQVLEAGLSGPPAIRLLFPENLPSVVVPRARVNPDLIEAALDRIASWLRVHRNFEFAGSRVRTALGGSAGLARSSLEDLTEHPRKAASTVLLPTEFTVRFWNHLANVIAADVGASPDRTSADQALLQSISLVSTAAIHRKTAADQAAERAADLKQLEAQVRKAPFVFTLEDLHGLKDDKGRAFAVKHGQDFITTFLATRTTPPEPTAGAEPGEVLLESPDELLPSLVQLGPYYIHRDLVAPLFLSKLSEAGEILRPAYVRDWVAQMREDEVPPASQNDAAFRTDVYRRVGDGFPVLAALADGPVLTLAARGPGLAENLRSDLRRCLDADGALRPFPLLLGLSRPALLKEARSYLPFWMTAPVISSIVRFFRLLLRGGSRSGAAAHRGAGPAASPQAGPGRATTEEARAGAERVALERMRRAAEAIIARYVPIDGSIDKTLDELADRWNPLLEPEQKKNLVRDVNALVLDFVRPIRSSFLMRPPDLERITALAEQLAASRSLAAIRNREPLLRYISIVMLRSLLQHRS